MKQVQVSNGKVYVFQKRPAFYDLSASVRLPITTLIRHCRILCPDSVILCIKSSKHLSVAQVVQLDLAVIGKQF